MHRTEVAQPAIFAMQVALAELWKSWGVQPAAVVGHSVGEVAAACVAGAFSLEQAARMIVLRARFMDDCARGEGTMLAVGLAEDEARAIIAPHGRIVTIAAFNGPRSLTLSGPRMSLEAIAAELEQRSIFARLVRVDHPFHHPLMQPASEALEAALADLAPKEENVPFFSTVTGRRHSGGECDAAHWGRGIRQPVQFAPAVSALATSAWMCGWKSARIPLLSVRFRNASRHAATSSPSSPPRGANASTNPCWRQRWTCTARAWLLISRP